MNKQSGMPYYLFEGFLLILGAFFMQRGFPESIRPVGLMFGLFASGFPYIGGDGNLCACVWDMEGLCVQQS